MLAYLQVDFVQFIMINFKIDKEMEAQKKFVCEQNHPSMYLGSIILFIMILSDLSEKMILLFNKERNFIFKFMIFIQIMLSVFILQCSVAYVFYQDGVINILINIPAFMFLNELGNIMAAYFSKHLKVHYPEITESDDFMRFEYVLVCDQAWYQWASTSVILICV